MILLEINGFKFDSFKDYEVTQSIDDVSGQFYFLAATNGKDPLPFPVESSCRILVDDTPIITGFVEVLSASYDSTEHIISVQGRDKTADVIDSTIGANIDFSGQIALDALIRVILDVSDIKNINVISEVDVEPFTSLEKISADIGDGVFDVIESYCRKRQVLITSNGDGDIVLTRGGVNFSGLSLYNNPATPQLNNIKSASVTYDNTNRYHQYTVKSQANISASNASGNIDNKEATAAKGTVTDSAIRVGRSLTMIAEKSSDVTQCINRARWQANINRARSLVYSVVVAGHTDVNGTPWKINELVKVDDIYSGLNGMYLINQATYRLTEEGTETTLNIVPADSYNLEPVAPPKLERSSKKAGFIL